MMRRRHAALWLAVAVWISGSSPCSLLSVHAATSSKTSSVRLSDVLAQGKRALKRGRRATEDAIDSAVHQVKHYPLQSVGFMFSVGLACGLAIGWLAGRNGK